MDKIQNFDRMDINTPPEFQNNIIKNASSIPNKINSFKTHSNNNLKKPKGSRPNSKPVTASKSVTPMSHSSHVHTPNSRHLTKTHKTNTPTDLNPTITSLSSQSSKKSSSDHCDKSSHSTISEENYNYIAPKEKVSDLRVGKISLHKVNFDFKFDHNDAEFIKVRTLLLS